MSQYNTYFTTNSSRTPKATIISLFLAGGVLIVAGVLLVLYNYASTHLPMHTTVNGIPVSTLTVPAAENMLSGKLKPVTPDKILLTVDTIQVSSDSANLDLAYDFHKQLTNLMAIPQESHTRWRVIHVLQRFFTAHTIVVPLSYNEKKIDAVVAALQFKVDTPAVTPSFSLKKTGALSSLQIESGKLGRVVDTNATKELLIKELATGNATVTAPIASTGAQLSEDEVKESVEWAKKFVGKSIKFTKEGLPITLNDQAILALLVPPHTVSDTQIDQVIQGWSKTIQRSPQDPVFEYDPQTLVVKTFVAPKTGLTLDAVATKQAITELIAEISKNDDAQKVTFEKPLALVEQAPQKSLSSTNNLGIKERIAFGESYYQHSIPNRIVNVALTTSKITNKIVKNGEEFSFNKTLGDVSAATGFKSAYVIKNGQTVLGDGGGVCQVSTTLFRAVLNGGLPVTKRIPHSYRVSYYELNSKPGVDATVYAGETDFRFINDTGHDVLIHAEADSKNLYMFVEIYGTSDGRTAQIIDHKTSNPRPAPPTVYIPDPTLPPGKLVQVDWSAPGIDASFTNVVKDKTGAIIRQDTYVSHYQPWSAKYLQGI